MGTIMSETRRVLFVTVGTTALSAKRLGDPTKSRIAEQLRSDCKTFLDKGEEVPDLRTRVLQAHEEFWKGGGEVFTNHDRTSAEMGSTYYALSVQVNKGGEAFPLKGRLPHERLFDPDHDRIVLLASDTPQGRFCAEVNETLMRAHLFNGPCADKPCTVVEDIKGLEAKEKGFDSKIVVSLIKIWAKYPARQIIVNITGGYKGALPALTWQCQQRDNCSMFYAHESMDRAEAISFFPQGPPKYERLKTIIPIPAPK
jgi:putative CRISPR-associated protein (TIGR02619 family)